MTIKRDTTRTPDQWRTMAREARQRSAESWERSDTDGFLSQWASDATAREYDAWAALAEDGYRAEFDALFDLDGSLLNAREIECRDFSGYGTRWVWRIKNSDGTTSWFNASQARKGKTRLANDRKKGYTIGRVLRDAYVTLSGASITAVGPVTLPVPESTMEPVAPVSQFYGLDY